MSKSSQSAKTTESTSPTKPKRVPFNTLYALPAPLRTFPLPTFVPHNPVSWCHILYLWLSQNIRPPTSNFDPLYKGWWSPETRSVHITDSRSIRGLWEQGFYGKGTLSRSEPNWMEREKTRRGNNSRLTSEDLTQQRRQERQHTKWERARKEREAIDQKLLEEAEQALQAITQSSISVKEPNGESNPQLATSDRSELCVSKTSRIIAPPVGPLELLSLPNSYLDLDQYLEVDRIPLKISSAEAELDRWFCSAPVGPIELLALPNSINEVSGPEIAQFSKEEHLKLHEFKDAVNGHTIAITGNQTDLTPAVKINGNGNGPLNGLGINGHASTRWQYNIAETSDEATDESVHSDDSTLTAGPAPNGSALANGKGFTDSPKIKRQKSVRFSPTVEKNTFIQSEPPSPERAITISATTPTEEEIQQKEHFQLTMEEAFFLSYGLGALSVLDPVTNSPITNEDLFTLFRKSSYYPPVANPSLSSDDPFLLNYIVYHHFRSLGWCVRGGAKFSCDFMLYNKGPVFSHAEFAILILPSYSDEYWSSDVFLQKYVKGKEHRTWAWMHCINRVIANVRKSLVLVYVDIPKPLGSDAEKPLGVDGLIKRYRVREFVLKRWQMNRERDVAGKP